MLTKLNKCRARGEGEERVSIYIYIYIQNTRFYECYIAVFRYSNDI